MLESKSQNVHRNEQGQAIVEYILMLFIALACITAFSFGLRKAMVGLWRTFAREITAPCPKCKNENSQLGG